MPMPGPSFISRYLDSFSGLWRQISNIGMSSHVDPRKYPHCAKFFKWDQLDKGD
jgi:hypothetical protein